MIGLAVIAVVFIASIWLVVSGIKDIAYAFGRPKKETVDRTYNHTTNVHINHSFNRGDTNYATNRETKTASTDDEYDFSRHTSGKSKRW